MPLSAEQRRELRAFGARMRRERASQNLTQEKLAEKADLFPRTIQKIEAGQLNILLTTVQRIRQALDCAWDDLLGKSE